MFAPNILCPLNTLLQIQKVNQHKWKIVGNQEAYEWMACYGMGNEILRKSCKSIRVYCLMTCNTVIRFYNFNLLM